MTLLVDLHRPSPRLGPGSDEQTRRALDLSGLRGRTDLRVADLGCGTGASSLVLAEDLDAHITAVDLFPEFLAELERRADALGVRAAITTVAASMDELPFEPSSLDAIWSEGAIYNIGFATGVAAWRHYLKPGGVLAVSEITWLTADPPAELREHWTAEYPEVGPASAKLAALEGHGYTPIGYFPLPVSSWLDRYYRPLQARFPSFLEQHAMNVNIVVARFGILPSR
ncbi:MAG: class I SAM-dependent methyltransferase [Deltaproteobacteria bacterium]|nr:class I SAM-dependent methyltransferase [Deltaproteobacteria bacterium]